MHLLSYRTKKDSLIPKEYTPKILCLLHFTGERYGFFVLIRNEVKDLVTALSLYRVQDVIEKAFWNIKEWFNLRRTLTSSESSLEGKLFVEFVALILISYIKKKIEAAGLFADYTMHELLDELDVIECFQAPGKAPIQGEVLKKQE